MRPLVLLRPEPGLSASAARARALGLHVIERPLFIVRPTPWSAPDPDDFDALLVTSANAVRLAGDELDRLRTLPVHAVGEATADAARAAGLSVATVGSGGVDALLAGLAGSPRLLHLCGRESLSAPSSAAVTPVIVYQADELADPGDFSVLEGAVVAVHSPRAGTRLAELADDRGVDRAQVSIAAISAPALQACGAGWREAAAASAIGDRKLLALAAELCHKPGE